MTQFATGRVFEVYRYRADETYPAGSHLATLEIGEIFPGQIQNLGRFFLNRCAVDNGNGIWNLGISTALRNTSGTNSQGAECSSETWLEISEDNANWSPIGGGIEGATYDVSAVDNFYLRVNVPASVSTIGNFLATFEMAYVVDYLQDPF